ncbi:MAG TPA: hypothetical protein VFS56_12695 [Gemmatimonadaceae bacterium]|nr:hypothetical protein [Gemmatimonadaceae bacterium]
MRQLLVLITIAGAMLAADTTPIAAQGVARLAPGSRVRLITPRLEASQQTVTVVSASSDSIQFRSVSYPVTRSLPLSEITAVEVRSYGERPFLRNMFIGGAVGGTLGAVAAYASYKECEDCWFYPQSRGRDTAGGALLGGLAGVVGGLIVAGVQRGERWTRIPLNANVALLPSLDGRFHFNLTRAF